MSEQKKGGGKFTKYSDTRWTYTNLEGISSVLSSRDILVLRSLILTGYLVMKIPRLETGLVVVDYILSEKGVEFAKKL